MFIAKAYAAENAEALADIAGAPTPGEALMMNLGLVAVLVGLFYLLLIMPQQKRFKEHSAMLADLKKGDRVVTGGGLVGKIEKVIDETEVLVDLGNGVKVTAVRTMLQGKTEMKPKATAKEAKSKDKK